jgi:GR25 family glycosyltransferase involved in LPS biosynthesis
MKYSIIKIDSRSENLISTNMNILKDFVFVDNIDYVDARTTDCKDVLDRYGIKVNWSPYDKRTGNPLPGELGIWVSTINTWKYIVNNNVDMLLVLEDDIVLHNDFVNRFNECIKDLPKNFDFFSLYYFNEHFLLEEETEIGSEYLHKSDNQYSAAQGILYSNSGAKKLLKLVTKLGIDYTCDCFIYKKAKLRILNGYSLKKNNDFLLTHENKSVKSIIDPKNIRIKL